MSLLDATFEAIIEFLIRLVNLLLLPIDALIKHLLPNFSVGLNYISSFFEWLCDLIPLAVSYLGLNSDILYLISSFLVFKLTVPIAIFTVKLAIKWYNVLKP